ELEKKLTVILNDNNQLAAKRYDEFEKSTDGKEYNNKLADLYAQKEAIQKRISETESEQHQQRKGFINDIEFTEFQEQKELDELAKMFGSVYRYSRVHS